MLSVALMAHPRRRAFVDELGEQLPDAEIVWDRRSDRWDTGSRALAAFDPAARFHVVVQDDAVLCRDFLEGAHRAAVAAGERPVALYTGATRPHQRQVAPAIKRCRALGLPFLQMKGPLWGVAIIVPTAHIPDLITWGDRHPEIENYDLRIAHFYRAMGVQCWYTVPSLVDHRSVAENPSLIAGRTGDRTAYWFIGEDASALDINWNPAPRAATKGQTMERRIADRRLYGYDRAGRRVLVAGKGQPIPAGYRIVGEESTPAKDVEAKPATAKPRAPRRKRAAKKPSAAK